MSAATRVWNYLTGYVIIDFNGRGLERFLNRAICAGVPIWGVRRTGDRSLRAATGIEGLCALRKIVRGSGVRISIVKKGGAPALLSRMRERKTLLFGWIALLAIMIALSRFVWVIEINGCDAVEEQHIFRVLAENGAVIGAPRSSLRTFLLGAEIMESDRRIAWAGAAINGVVLKIDIAEADTIEESEEKRPASIYAKKDGIVKRVIVLSGKALVAAGDAVEAGQELISGIIREDEETGRLLSHAEGEITAEVLYVISASAGPSIMKPVRGEFIETLTEISLPSLGIDLAEAAEETEDEVCAGGTITGCFLPIRFEMIKRYAVSEAEAAGSEKELIEAALALAEERALAAIPEDARILSRRSEHSMEPNGAARATIYVTTEEDIGITRDLE